MAKKHHPEAGGSICPIYLACQMNGIYYYYAQVCPSGAQSTMSSRTQLNLGCSNPQRSDCVPTSSPIGGSPRDEHHGVGDVEDGIERRLPPGTVPFVVPGVTAVVLPDTYQTDHPKHYVQLIEVTITPPEGTSSQPLPTIEVGFGQEAPGVLDPLPLHVVGPPRKRYLKVEDQQGRIFHVLLTKKAAFAAHKGSATKPKKRKAPSPTANQTGGDAS